MTRPEEEDGGERGIEVPGALIRQARAALADRARQPDVHESVLELYGVGWKDAVTELAVTLDPDVTHPAERERMLNILSDLSWQARAKGLGRRDDTGLAHLVTRRGPAADLARVIIELQLARYDFDHARIRTILAIADDELLRGGNIGPAFAVFAELASGVLVSEEEIIGITHDSNPLKVRHLVLHGMWLYPRNRYGREMVEVATQILRDNPRDWNALARRAEGYRRLGSDPDPGDADEDGGQGSTGAGFSCYDLAVRDIDTAISLLGPEQTDIHADYTRHRLLITNERQLRESFNQALAAETVRLREVVEEVEDELDHKTQDMLFRVIEILSLFVAVIGILASNITFLASGDLDLGERLILMGAVSALFVVFFVVVHLSVTWRTTRRTTVKPRRLDRIDRQLAELHRDVEALKGGHRSRDSRPESDDVGSEAD